MEAFLGRPGAVTTVDTLAAGHSNETYRLGGIDMILRTPPEGPGLLPPYDMKRQHDVLADIRQAAPDVPVPRVYGVCTDEKFIGAPFYLCSAMRGESFEYEAPAWLAECTPEFRHRLCEQWITAIATVNRTPPQPSLGRPLTPEAVYGEWRKRAQRNSTKSKQHAAQGLAIATVFDTLSDLGFVRSGEPAVVHGDPKIGNTLWHGGKLTALLDWEMAHNGEPLYDLGYVLGWFPGDIDVRDIPLPSYDYFALPGMFSRGETIKTWEKVSGRSARGVEVYEVAAIAKLAGILHQGAIAYETGALPDERMAQWGAVIDILLKRAYDLLALLPVKE
ncbi:phosphotransferase family protein [Mycobacterium branderi]|uniref:Aminoglycoside phosphotransferase domain-containing protein n=1 Tax=Mycobacterium branderi TaxID=43348 RepID=A0AA91M0S4_9MYCO|nr:phosphotransferase family protein [Mycobacterium branderi]MCV7231733.1 phosphotransferase family protein [Mycobacterium branderi]ORA40299.1 hypothetical protein BST20_07040 [Mycobacterium branderi]